MNTPKTFADYIGKNYTNDPNIDRKGYGRIFVMEPEQIELVHLIIKNMDPYEYDGYMPENFVTVFKPTESNRFVYNGKFDIKVTDLIENCKKMGFDVLVASSWVGDEYCDLDSPFNYSYGDET